MLKSHAVRSTPESVEAVTFPEAGTKLKSERVQLDLQLLPGDGGVLRTLAEGGSVTLQAVTLSLAFDAVSPGAVEGDDEAGPASGTPDHDDGAWTGGKEVGRADTALAR